jgi:hypothetical protein
MALPVIMATKTLSPRNFSPSFPGSNRHYDAAQALFIGEKLLGMVKNVLHQTVRVGDDFTGTVATGTGTFMAATPDRLMIHRP